MRQKQVPRGRRLAKRSSQPHQDTDLKITNLLAARLFQLVNNGSAGVKNRASRAARSALPLIVTPTPPERPEDKQK